MMKFFSIAACLLFLWADSAEAASVRARPSGLKGRGRRVVARTVEDVVRNEERKHSFILV